MVAGNSYDKLHSLLNTGSTPVTYNTNSVELNNSEGQPELQLSPGLLLGMMPTNDENEHTV